MRRDQSTSSILLIWAVLCCHSEHAVHGVDEHLTAQIRKKAYLSPPGQGEVDSQNQQGTQDDFPEDFRIDVAV